MTKRQASERAAERKLHKQHTLHAFLANAPLAASGKSTSTGDGEELTLSFELMWIVVVSNHCSCQKRQGAPVDNVHDSYAKSPNSYHLWSGSSQMRSFEGMRVQGFPPFHGAQHFAQSD